jgi:hypothetical protein
MASTMHACARPKSAIWCSALAGLGLCLGVIALAGAAGFRINAVEPHEDGDALRLSGALDLALTSKVEEALSNGIPLEFAVNFRLYRRRALLWDETMQAWSVRRQLHYHALSGQYLIRTEQGAAQSRGGYSSLAEALRRMGSLADVRLPLDEPLEPGGDYRLGVRVALDIEALPPLLRPVAYTSRAWDLNSGWTTWKVQR